MSYEPTNWKKGDKVTSTRLNKIEQGIQGNDTEITNVKEDLQDIDVRVEALEDGGTGISDNAIDLLDQLGSHIAFTSAQGGQLWDDLIDELRNSTPSVMHTVTWTGSDYTASNTATSTKEGRPYTTTISPNEGYVISAVTASMGNEVITPTNNGDGTYTVSIASVTADIAISVTTQVDTSDIMYHVENLVCDGTQQPIETPLQFSSASANGVMDNWTLCARAIQSARADYAYVFASGNDGSRLAWDSYSGGNMARIRMVGNNFFNTLQSMINNSTAVVITHAAGNNKTLTCHYIDKTTGAITVDERTAQNGVNYLDAANAQTPLLVGAKTDGTDAFVGTIEDITIYNRTLTAEEISAYLTGGKSA